MNKFTLVGCALLMAVVVVGCAKSDDDLMKEQITIMEEMTKDLATVKDKATAETAKTKLDGHFKRLEDNGKIMKAWPKEKLETLHKKYADKGDAVHKKFMDALATAASKSGGVISEDAVMLRFSSGAE